MAEQTLPKKLSVVLGAAAEIEREQGLTVFLVGGSVRQILQGKAISDIDLVVDADGGAADLAEALAQRFDSSSRPVSINTFPTTEVRINGFTIQISETEKPRSNDAASIYAPLSDRMKADVLRRDFTVNTLLLPVSNPTPGAVIDPLGIGLKDLERRVLRTPVEPSRTFGADPLRLLRAVRFATVDGFEIDEEIQPVIRQMAGRLEKVPGERVNVELSLIICSDRPVEGIGMLIQFGLLRYIFPTVEHLASVDQPIDYYGDNVLNHSLTVVSGTPPILRLRLAALFHDIGKAQTRQEKDGKVIFHGHQYTGAEQAREALKRLRFPNKLVDDVARLVEMHMVAYREEWSDTAVRRLVHDAGELLDDLLLLYRADILARAKPHNDLGPFEHLMQRIKNLDLDRIIHAHSPLSGEEVMDILGLAEGPLVGEAQDAIEQAIIDGRIDNTAAASRKYLLKEVAPRLKKKTL